VKLARAVFLVVLASLLALAPVWSPPSALAGAADKTLEVYWIDVEGGGATLIVTPAGESILVDAGNPGPRDAARIHEAATKAAGLTKIDHLVVTHFHVDHFGGVAELAKLMPIGTLYDNGVESAPEKERGDARLAAYMEAAAGKRVTLAPGQRLALARAKGAAPLAVEILGTRTTFVKRAGRPNAACASAAEKPADASDNRNSAVLRLSFGPFRFFDGGDLTWNTEAALVCPRDRVGPVDVYQTNHHGLDVSNNPVLVRALAPTVAVMNNGPRKGCQPETFATLKGLPTLRALYQLHKNVRPGETHNTDDARIANLEERCAGHFVKMTVDPDGKRYALSIPATGQTERFETRRR
jgi:beta-lactamase superfamily II metal-dependent hydrolase